MGFLDFFAQIVWIAAGLAVFLTVVLYFLPDVYHDWRTAKVEVDYNMQLHELVVNAIQEVEETGKTVTLKFTPQGEEHGTSKEDEECDQREQPQAD